MNLAEQEPLQEELENLELWTRYIGQRTVELRNELVLKYTGLVRKIALRFKGRTTTMVSWMTW